MTKYIIGDVHGCVFEFEYLVCKLKPAAMSDIILVGDLMDKGPEPAKCVSIARQAGICMILGNHEERHIKWYKHKMKKREDPSYVIPMKPLSEEDQIQNDLLTQADFDWLCSLPRTVQFDNWVIVHGGLFPGKSVEEQLKDKGMRDKIVRLRWIGEDGKHVPVDYENLKPGAPDGACHWTEVYTGAENVVYGHEAFNLSTPYVVKKKHGPSLWGIDTGVVHGGHLTALVIEDNQATRCIRVKASKEYKKPLLPIPGGT